ncbi:N-formylglutamate amidohydrolase [Sphingosinicella rhizophila]|uniref:N-formylglutamate amidohydrolase n=1 Tax=Sphingosinicella rhizophila TaxID=3050082 RepID=A0ABU3QCD8_9SPHN|nr:N-formylglutamate amidohydrolase [Sphingosinicella sp. GR2756]MDT9600814.1 N-formylglutamate amidohydrolase [Sphingosinicella sp. GR2756]
MTDSPAALPFRRTGPARPSSPVVLSVPHAGRSYTDALLRSSRLPLTTLESLEDRLVDRLVWRAVANGACALIADVPRAEIDLNRDEREIDPAIVAPAPPAGSILQSPRSRGGLGLVPSRMAGAGPIWRQRMTAGELRRRIDEVHRPYHETLEEMLEAARSRHGYAILLDCHSMPARDEHAGTAPIVLGDRYGTSCSPGLVDAASHAVAAAGLVSGRNAPYAGGYITARHGRPVTGIHALQIEIDRSLYLASDLRSPGPGFDAMAALIASVAAALAFRAAETEAIAAE